MRGALVVVALILVPAVAAGVVHAADLQPAAANDSGEDAPVNEIAHLSLTGDTSEGLTNQSVDAASAVSIGRSDATARLEDYATAERLNRTNETVAVLNETVADLEARVGALEADQRSTWMRYANGTTGSQEFARDAAYLQARAARLDGRLSRVEGLASRYGAPSQNERIDRLQRRILGHTGPVREQALAAMAGERSSLDLYVAGSENGTVLASIDGSEYVRDAYRTDRQQSPPREISSNAEAFNRFQELYPVAFARSGATTIQGVDGNETYLFLKQLSGYGSLLSYLDGNTRDAFHEVQRRDLETLDQPASETATANGTRLVVNRSYTGGPLRIATYDADTGNATPRPVRVGDRQLDPDGDGISWTLMPPGTQVDVTATTANGSVSVTVEPLDLTPVNASG